MAEGVPEIESGAHATFPLILAHHLSFVDARPLDGVRHCLHRYALLHDNAKLEDFKDNLRFLVSTDQSQISYGIQQQSLCHLLAVDRVHRLPGEVLGKAEARAWAHRCVSGQ